MECQKTSALKSCDAVDEFIRQGNSQAKTITDIRFVNTDDPSVLAFSKELKERFGNKSVKHTSGGVSAISFPFELRVTVPNQVLQGQIVEEIARRISQATTKRIHHRNPFLSLLMTTRASSVIPHVRVIP